MEDKKKRFPPRREGGDRQEGGQRITVRPGNFAPPPQKGSPAPAPKKENSGKTPETGKENGQNRRNNDRNRHGRGNNKKHRRPEGQNDRQNANIPQNGAKNNQQSGRQEGQKENRGRPQNDRRRDRREQRPQRQETANEVTLSPSLQRALNEEFGTPTLSPFTSSLRKDRAKEAEAVDSAEFAVDIATAAYLTEDIPCGFPIPDGNAVEVVGVRFRRAGKMYFFAPGTDRYTIGQSVLVDTARGPEIGEIVMLKRRIAEKDVVQPLRAVLRVATPEDKAHEQENRAKEVEALKICAEKIAHHKLDMHLVDAQFTFDNSKLLFYFTSEGRVDFRELVRDLAGVFHTRIELRQIGIRDESRLIGGLGMCGRPFCCSTFLSDFGQVSIKMAKEQGLSINTSKISGCCGRLMCCLRYEHETYAAEAKLTPKKDTPVSTPDGNGVVIEAAPLAGTVKVKLDNLQEGGIKTYPRDSVTPLAKATEKPAATEAPAPEGAEE